MPSSADSPDPLRNLLNEAESELSRRLQEACDAEARGVSTESAQEIRELEDSLLAAAMAAEKVITARRHLWRSAQGKDGEAAAGERNAHAGSEADPEPEVRSADAGAPHATGGTDVREFEDEAGRGWRAWPVTPDLARAQEASRRSLGVFQEGWICFEALDNSGRRRLPRQGRRWSDLSPEELPGLLAEAINVPARKPRRPDALGAADTGGMN